MEVGEGDLVHDGALERQPKPGVPGEPHPKVRTAARGPQVKAKLLVNARVKVGEQVPGDPVVATIRGRAAHRVLVPRAQLQQVVGPLTDCRNALAGPHA